MAPQKFASVRHRTRPAAARLTPFRDDTSLVALRYEETKQAEPPIPLPPPRNPRRLTIARSPSSTIAPTAPIVVNPPPIPPPQEEHPLFRNARTPPSPRSRADECKRDSGAPTASSVTLREEFADDPVYQKLLDDIADAPSVYSGDEQGPDASPTADSQFAPPPLRIASIPRRTDEPDEIVSPTQPVASVSASPQTPLTLTRKLSKSFNVSTNSSGSKRLRKKMLGADRAASQGASPTTVRGSANTHRPPKSPKSPKSPKLPPQQTGPSDADDREHDSSGTLHDFAPINTPIPEDSLWDDLGSLSFSKRGSIMFGGKGNNLFKSIASSSTPAKPATPAPAATAATATPEDPAASTSSQQPHPATTHDAQSLGDAAAAAERPRPATHADSPSVPRIRVSSIDVERESQKVRSLYESGDDLNWEDGGRVSFAEPLEPTEEVPSEEEENVVYGFPLTLRGLHLAGSMLTDALRLRARLSRPSDHLPSDATPGDHRTAPTPATATPRSANSLSRRRDSQVRREYEWAGGIEDWENLEGVIVDRYGFITHRRPVSSAETAVESNTSHLTPRRRRNVLTKRPATAYSSSAPGGSFMRPPSRKVSARSLNTYTSELSAVSQRSTRSSIRSATNRLPHNRDRRWMDEAGEMLSLQAGLTGITDEDKMGKTLEAQRRKEAERSEKWRKMATVVKGGKGGQGQAHGQGIHYEFDTKNAKLIERTWKGIPDCWRSAAWYSFLASSARAWQSTETDEHLIAEFKRLQRVASPDDVQIDLDVPRTVNGHIMFRRRYRGGQRLLFRVLHAISLYFPETGYVQGMASLAATLLCYFDEERCFIMLVRLWRYRGLEHLYAPGFAGLMAALEDFEKRWLAGKDVASKLVSCLSFSIPVGSTPNSSVHL